MGRPGCRGSGLGIVAPTCGTRLAPVERASSPQRRAGPPSLLLAWRGLCLRAVRCGSYERRNVEQTASFEANQCESNGSKGSALLIEAFFFNVQVTWS